MVGVATGEPRCNAVHARRCVDTKLEHVNRPKPDGEYARAQQEHFPRQIMSGSEVERIEQAFAQLWRSRAAKGQPKFAATRVL